MKLRSDDSPSFSNRSAASCVYIALKRVHHLVILNNIEKQSNEETHPIFTFSEDGVNVFVRNARVLRSKDVIGTMLNHVEHLVIVQCVVGRILLNNQFV